MADATSPANDVSSPVLGNGFASSKFIAAIIAFVAANGAAILGLVPENSKVYAVVAGIVALCVFIAGRSWEKVQTVKTAGQVVAAKHQEAAVKALAASPANPTTP